MTLAAAEQDKALCGEIATQEATCGTMTAIFATNDDENFGYFYDSTGTLVAISGGGSSFQPCLGGPGYFTVLLSACENVHTLSVCTTP